MSDRKHRPGPADVAEPASASRLMELGETPRKAQRSRTSQVPPLKGAACKQSQPQFRRPALASTTPTIGRLTTALARIFRTAFPPGTQQTEGKPSRVSNRFPISQSVALIFAMVYLSISSVSIDSWRMSTPPTEVGIPPPS